MCVRCLATLPTLCRAQQDLFRPVCTQVTSQVLLEGEQDRHRRPADSVITGSRAASAPTWPCCFASFRKPESRLDFCSLQASKEAQAPSGSVLAEEEVQIRRATI